MRVKHFVCNIPNQFISIAFFCFLLTLTSCDPFFEVDFEVWNDSGKPIAVIVDHGNTQIDSNMISDFTRLIFFIDEGIGSTTEDYMDAIQILPVELTIKDEHGNPYNKDENDLSLWTKYYPEKKGGTGKIQLRVRPADFE